MMLDINTYSPILITGATGYIGSWVTRLLLEKGASLHITVRDLTQTSHYQHLIDMAQTLPGHAQFFEADLTQEGSFAEAMHHTQALFHIASPFKLAVSDPQAELIGPALQGTQNILHQACHTPSMQKVILTSSCAAMFGDNIDLNPLKDKTLTENSWNTTSSLKHNPYSHSKTLAEQAAWDIAKQQSQWQMIALNPCLVMGPSISPYSNSESLHLLRQFKEGALRPGVANIGIGIVDVRDVAQAHFNALISKTATGRHILCGHSTSFLEIAHILYDNFGATYPIPHRALPKALCWLVGPYALRGITRKYIEKNVNIPWQADTRKSISELNMSYRSLPDTLIDAFNSL